MRRLRSICTQPGSAWRCGPNDAGRRARVSRRDDLIVLGAVAGAFGVRGEVRLKSFTAQPEDLFDYSPFLDAAGRVALTVESWRHVKNGFAAYTAEVTSREEAEALKSLRLHAPRARLPGLEVDEFYHADLLGLAVQSLAGADLGQVKAVLDFGSGDVLEIHRTPGVKGSWFLPFTLDAAPHVDLEKRVIVADPPPEIIAKDPGGAANSAQE